MRSSIHAAFAFLTILAPGKMFTNACMKKSVFFYPLVGIALGIILFFTCALTLFITKSPQTTAAIFFILSFFLTRGLHHDGLADIADAWGSGARGEKFRVILKDSRIGSFGTIVLVLYYLLAFSALSDGLQSSQLSNAKDFWHFLTNIFSNPKDSIFILFMATFWGRIGLIAQPAFDSPFIPKNTEFSKVREAATLMHASDKTQVDSKVLPENKAATSSHETCTTQQDLPPSTLSQNMKHPSERKRFLFWLIVFSLFSFIFLTKAKILFIVCLSTLSLFAYLRLSYRENGYNGDFLGAQCLCFELIAFLSVYV